LGKFGAHLWAMVAETLPLCIFPPWLLSSVYNGVMMMRAAQWTTTTTDRHCSRNDDDDDVNTALLSLVEFSQSGQ